MSALHRVALAIVLVAPVAFAEEHGIVGSPPVVDVRPVTSGTDGQDAAEATPAASTAGTGSTAGAAAVTAERERASGPYRPPAEGEGDPR
ncbi:MAG TPA: hypothetical protein VF912_04960 [Anaeromyxobacter sp.]